MPFLKHYLKYMILAIIIGHVSSAAITTSNNALIRLPRVPSPPANVTNYITWINDGRGTSQFCEWEDLNFNDNADCDLWVWDCNNILTNTVIKNGGNWFEVSRDWDAGNSTFVRVASVGSCMVQVAMLNGTNAAVSFQDIEDKLNETIQKGPKPNAIFNLRPSYGKMRCPVPTPDQVKPLDITVEWMIGCSAEGASITSLPQPVL